jgi:uncharacterized delta-60 repeat protein
MKNSKPLRVAAVVLGLVVGSGLSESAFAEADGAAASADHSQDTIRRDGPTPNQAALDGTFNPGRFTDGSVTASLLLPDGKLIIGGSFNKVHGVDRHGLARLNADGTLDETFDAGAGPGGWLGGVFAGPPRIVRQSDGKLIVSGLSSFDGLPRNGVARLNPDGSLDTGYNPGRGLSRYPLDDGNGNPVQPGYVTAVVVQADGKVLLYGYFDYVFTGPGTYVSCSGIARFHADGTFDFDFPRYGGVAVNKAAQRPDGKIYVLADLGLYLFNADGTVDQSYGPGELDQSTIPELFVQQNGQLILFGSVTTKAGAPPKGLVRLSQSGAVDPTFNPPALLSHDGVPGVSTVAEQSDGQLIVGGNFHRSDGEVANGIVRLASNGTRDGSFSGAGTGNSGSISTIAIRPGDGAIFAGGNFTTFAGVRRHTLAWLSPGRLTDETFVGLSGATDYAPQINSIVPQPDGKILVGGSFSSFDGAPRNNLLRFNSDGTLDPTFDPNLEIDGSIRNILLQPDGKIVVAGLFRGVNGVRAGGIARLNGDGTLDSSFDAGTGSDISISTIVRDSDGNFFVGGLFSAFNGVPRARIAKLGPDGALDVTFDPGSGFTSPVLAIAPDGAGNIHVGGSFNRHQGTTALRYVRLSATTAERTSSPTHAGANGVVRAIERSPDGKFYVGGDFTTFDGVSRSKIVRLDSNGLVDSFVGPTLDFNIRTLAAHGNKVVLGGFGPEGSPRLRRLTETGSHDDGFAVGTGITWSPATAYSGTFGPIISAIAVDGAGRTLIGGTFNQYNGAPRICLARLTSAALNFTAVSRKVHGNEGPFDIPLPLTGATGVECRSGGAGDNHQVVFNFGGAVTFTNAAVTSGSGSVASIAGSGTNTATVDLSGVTSGQHITVTLSSVTDGTITSDLGVPMSILVGDTTGNGSVTASDIGQVKGQSGQLVTGANFRTDVNVSGGSISASDIGFVKARTGTQLP